LAAYVAGLTYAARQETLAKMRNAWPLLMLATPVAALAASMILRPDAPWWGWAVLAGFVGWSGHGLRLILVPAVRDGRRAVGVLIAGICLLDAGWAAAYGRAELTLVAVLAFGLTLAAHRKVAGT
jgi:4-hydroxybenzoate polyprenyltransferase